MDFTIDIYNEFHDGKCIGNNYFTLANYLSAVMDLDVVLKGVLSLGGYAALTGLTEADYDILRGALRKTIHGDEYVDVQFYTYDYYEVKKLGFEMHIPTSTYNLDAREHGAVNATFSLAQRYLQEASAHHSMGELIANAASAYALSGATSSFSSILYVEVSEIKYESFIAEKHVTSEMGGSSSGHSGQSGHDGSSGQSGSSGSTGDSSSSSSGGGGEVEPVSFETDGGEDAPTLSRTLLSYANIKMGAFAFFALSVMVFLVQRYRTSRGAGCEQDPTSLLDVSTSRLLRSDQSRTKHRKKRSSRDADGETDELLANAEVTRRSNSSEQELEMELELDLEEGEEDHSGSRRSSNKGRQAGEKKQKKRSTSKSSKNNEQSRKKQSQV